MICPSPLGGVCIMCARERREEHKIAAFVSWAIELGQAEAVRLPQRRGPTSAVKHRADPITPPEGIAPPTR
jgi:hypothetical protein